MNETQTAAFFNTTNPYSFGSAIVDQNALNAVWFDCHYAIDNNCTSGELADKQWGASSITHNPRITSETEDPVLDNYFNITYTMTGWGAYTVIGAPVSPEFMYYFNQRNPKISYFSLSET